jgi:hypothetical protein
LLVARRVFGGWGNRLHRDVLSDWTHGAGRDDRATFGVIPLAIGLGFFVDHALIRQDVKTQYYLEAHPQVHQELSENPQTFLQSTQQFNTHSTARVGESKPK